MSKSHEHHAEAKDESGERFSSDLEALKSSFAQLRDDVAKILDTTLDTGKNGAALIKDRASTAVGNLKHRMEDVKDSGVESVEKIGERIAERPLLSAAIAIGIGFVLAKLFTAKR